MKVIVTGSRDWPDMEAVCRALDLALTLAQDHGAPLTVVHGGCPMGADAMAAAWVRLMRDDLEMPVIERVFEANWERYKRRAGPIRNRRMVEAGADYVIAFNRNHGRGTSGTIALADEAGIPVIRIDAEDKEAA
ncbi:SLOG family protein [Nonomuraea longicatena]|uniref:YspA cpYpsA-related SLOG domain-containing protein n=1 Tax=Nonomuraea longicatena TaxID=83682 RepID=A0ABN1RE29_9ACTN